MSFIPPRPESIAIAGPCGSLDAILEVPDGINPSSFGVVCHPHPQQGGTMTNKVVHTLARTFNECGTPTLRFNYRGVGKSAGEYDAGVGETEDALAVIAWGRQRWPDAQLWLAGFSFGGGVALRAALRTPVARLIMVAPAAARDPLPSTLPECPWLVLQGEADEVIDPVQVTGWVRAIPEAQRPDYQLMSEAGHFFHGRLPELRATVRSWLMNQPV